MSINYHAFQNRGFLLASNEALCEQWRKRFSEYDPARAAQILDLTADTEYLYVTYYGNPYRLRQKDGILEKKTDPSGVWTEDLFFNEAMAIYHLLYYTSDHPGFSGIWVPNTALRGAGTHNHNLPDPLLTPFAARFSGRTELLRTACEKHGGQKIPASKADVAFQFFPFAQTPLQLLFWDAEEDFPAQAQILMDKQITDFIHFETTGCLISDLLEKLEAEL